MLFTAVVAAQDSVLRFEVASIRPNLDSARGIPVPPSVPDGLRLTNYPLDAIIRRAYGVQPFRMTGLPNWASEESFDIEARASGPITEPQRQLMLRTLLAERFDLKARFEQRTGSVYILTKARADGPLGSGMKPRPDCETTNCVSAGGANPAGGTANINTMTVDNLASGLLSSLLGQVVRDESGVSGRFDIQLSWRPDTSTDPNDGRPSFFTAVEEQLGLKLTSARRPVDFLVIDSISRLKPN